MLKYSILILSLTQLAYAKTVLQIGQSIEFPNPERSIWAKKNDCLEIRQRGNKTELLGSKACYTKVKIGKQIHHVHVLTESQIQLQKRLKNYAERTPGLSVEVEKGEITVEGTLYSWKIWKELRELVNDNTFFILKTQLDENLLDTFQNEINYELSQQGLLSVNVKTSPQISVGLNPSQQYQRQYIQYFQQLGIQVDLDKENLTTQPTVKVKIRILEVAKSSSQALGLIWPTEASFTVLSPNKIQATPFALKLAALESSGEVLTLANPTLICRSGKEAEFFAGGDYPIRLKGYRAEQLQWVKYGVGLKIRPQADSGGRINLTIETDISNLSSIIDGIPTVESSKVSSHFDLAKSQVVALSGIFRQQNSRSAEGLPFLTRLPILGKLFSSSQYQSQKSELVILVEPQLMEN